MPHQMHSNQMVATLESMGQLMLRLFSGEHVPDIDLRSALCLVLLLLGGIPA